MAPDLRSFLRRNRAGRVKELAVYLQAKAKLWNADKAGGSAPELEWVRLPQYVQAPEGAAVPQYVQTLGSVAAPKHVQIPEGAELPEGRCMMLAARWRQPGDSGNFSRQSLLENIGTMEENSLKTWIEEYRRMILRLRPGCRRYRKL